MGITTDQLHVVSNKKQAAIVTLQRLGNIVSMHVDKKKCLTKAMEKLLTIL